MIPVTVDDLEADGLLGEAPPSPSAGQVHQVCWERSVKTLTARKDDIAGLAVASDERIEAYLLYATPTAEIVSLRSFVEDRGARLTQLLSPPRSGDVPVPQRSTRPKSPRNCWKRSVSAPAGAHVLYAAKPQSG